MAAVWRWVRVANVRWSAVQAVLAAASFISTAAPAFADDLQEPIGEVWSGADISRNVWLAYSGITLSPWSSIYDDGFRFRAAGSYGVYRYAYTHYDTRRDAFLHRRRDAETYASDLLLGYVKRLGELTAKVFAGVSVIGHRTELPNEVVGMGDEVGVKGAIELWLNIGDRGWGSLDMWWASAYATRSARARLGYRVWPNLSFGVEAGLNVDREAECRVKEDRKGRCGHVVVADNGAFERDFDGADLLDYARAGAFARYEWGWNELSVSGGVLRDTFSGEEGLAPYMTVNWLVQF